MRKECHELELRNEACTLRDYAGALSDETCVERGGICWDPNKDLHAIQHWHDDTSRTGISHMEISIWCTSEIYDNKGEAMKFDYTMNMIPLV
jgi:hypothetical protein